MKEGMFMKYAKRICSIFLSLALALGLLPVPNYMGIASAQASEYPISGTCGVNGDNIKWELQITETDQGYVGYKLVITGSGDMENFDDYGENCAPWYAYRMQINSVEIGDNITSIGDYAFNSLKEATEVSIGNSVKTIGTGACRTMGKLHEIIIPDSVEKIEALAFVDTRLKSITFGAGLKEIGPKAFFWQKDLHSVTFNEGLKIIGSDAFSSSGLIEIKLPDTLEEIGDYAFSEMGILKSLNIPANVNKIGKGIVYGDEELEKITIASENEKYSVIDSGLYEMKEGKPYSLIAFPLALTDAVIAEGTEVIAEKTFYRDARFPGLLPLKSVYIPNTVKKISYSAFCDTSLTELTIPDSVTEMGISSISFNSKLMSISIGKGVKDIEVTSKDENDDTWDGVAIYENHKLEYITVDDENPNILAEENVVYNKKKTELYLYAPMKPDKEYHVEDAVERISTYAFLGAENIERIFMPQALKRLGKKDDYYYGPYASLKNYICSESADVYFKGNAPVGHVAGSGIVYRLKDSTGWQSDSWKNYTGKFAYWDPNDMETGEGVIDNISWKYTGMNRSLSLTGSGSLPDFSEDNPVPWQKYMGKIQTVEINGVYGIGANSFKGADKLLRVRVDCDLKEFGDYAFADCINLKGLDIYKAENIGTEAFRNNKNIEEVILQGVKTIGSGAFKGCSALKFASLGGRIKTIGSGAFKGCSALNFASLGGRIKTLENEVFAGDSALSYFIIPESVTEIRDGVFKGCQSLRTINIPKNVAQIGAEVFSGADKLEKVYFYGGIPANINNDAFKGCGSSDAGITLYYRTGHTDWEALGGAWNNIPVEGLSRFFNEQRDGYSFPDSRRSFGYSENYRIPCYRYIDLLNSTIMGNYYYVITNKGRWNSSAYGMAATALEFYENDSFNVADYDADAKTLYDLKAPQDSQSRLTKLIEGYQISRYMPKFSGYDGAISRNLGGYRGLIKKVEEFERSGGLREDSEAEPIMILCGSQVLVPLSVQQNENGDFEMQVYDCRYPSELQTATISSDFRTFNYFYKQSAVSYVGYSGVAQRMTGIRHYGVDTKKDTSIYLSVDKEKGKVVNKDGKGIDEIEGAYEQFFIDDVTDMSSFVVPAGEYTFKAADGTEEDVTTKNVTEEGSIKFYMATCDTYMELTSNDEKAVCEVKTSEDNRDKFEISLTSNIADGETSQIVVMNEEGMRRDIETDISGKLNIVVDNGQTITVNVPDNSTGSISVDGNELAVEEGKAVSSFVAGADENPLKVDNFNAEFSCDSTNYLTGDLNASIIFNSNENINADVGVQFEDEDGNVLSSWEGKEELHGGMNGFSLNLGEQKMLLDGSGEKNLKCVVTVKDEKGNAAITESPFSSLALSGQQGSGGTDNPELEVPIGKPTEKPTVPPLVTPSAEPANKPSFVPYPAGGSVQIPQATSTPVPLVTNKPTEAPATTTNPFIKPTGTPAVTTSPTASPAVPEKTEAPGQKNPEVSDNTDSGKDESDAKAKLSKGSKITDKKTKAVYKILNKGKNKTVEYVRSTKKNKSAVVISDTVKLKGKKYKIVSIANSAFENNKNLQKVKIGKNVKVIGKNAFKGCKKLKNVKVGKKVSVIGANAFSKCKSLSIITIPAKATKIGGRAFYKCSNLRYILVKTNKLTTGSVGKDAFSEGYSNPRVKTDKSMWKQYRNIFVSRGLSNKALFVINPVKLII